SSQGLQFKVHKTLSTGKALCLSHKRQLTQGYLNSCSLGSMQIVLPPPEPFYGDLNQVKGFLMQCSLALARSPSTFPNDAMKLLFFVSLLRGKALICVFTPKETVSMPQIPGWVPYDKKGGSRDSGEETGVLGGEADFRQNW
uniref:Uncharacterized protein n=1 Tax=Amphilophus citrinellus TaxID=61819 RepID=A0A3Q0RK84_AMPCI